MARLKQLEPKKETIGGLNFYIRPFPAMVAANLTGDLASLLTPVLAALMPLVGDSDNEGDDEDGDLMDIDVNDAADCESVLLILDGTGTDSYIG